MKDKFLGAWELVSFIATKPDGSVISPLGRTPTGSITYAPNWVSVHMMRSDRKHPEPGRNYAALPDELIGPLARTYVAYAGTWDCDEAAGTVTHTVEQALDPDLLVAPQLRNARFIGADQLELSAPVGAGVYMPGTLLWKRIAR